MSFIKKIIRNFVIIFYKIIFHLLKTKNNIILFESSNGRNYSGNPKYIYEKLINSSYSENFKCVWSLDDTSIFIPGNPIKVRRTRLKYLYYSIISKFWVFDSRHPQYLKKKDKCEYIQTWHGTPLKKLALDMDKLNMGGNTDIKEYKNNFRENSKLWDYLIDQNDFSKKTFKRAFDFNGIFLDIGYPRNDILINNKNDSKLISKLKKKFNIYENKKIILYAPTWRDNDFHKEGFYKFTSEMDFEAIKKELSDDYVMIVKYHYLVKDKVDWSSYSDFIIVADEKSDIQELFLVSDILITDYSSVMFDYSLLKRPMIFYTYDIEFYKNKLRDFYFDLEKEAPGPIVETNTELIKILKNFNFDEYSSQYHEKYSKFIAKYNQYDNGKSSQKIIDLINNS